jgi:hypothetical protein
MTHAQIALPANLPNIAHATLPKTYERARDALAKCGSLDECRDWADKAAALASYAKQAGDDTLRKMADRIQARAIRRCGELLRQIAPKSTPGRLAKNCIGADTISRSQAARDAGLSRRQKVDALRVANVPASAFETVVESDNPPTVTALAQQGRRVSTAHLRGRDPKDFARATQGQGHVRRLAEFAASTEAAQIARGTLPHERAPMRHHIEAILPWLRTLTLLLKDARDST